MEGTKIYSQPSPPLAYTTRRSCYALDLRLGRRPTSQWPHPPGLGERRRLRSRRRPARHSLVCADVRRLTTALPTGSATASVTTAAAAVDAAVVAAAPAAVAVAAGTAADGDAANVGAGGSTTTHQRGCGTDSVGGGGGSGSGDGDGQRAHRWTRRAGRPRERPPSSQALSTPLPPPPLPRSAPSMCAGRPSSLPYAVDQEALLLSLATPPHPSPQPSDGGPSTTGAAPRPEPRAPPGVEGSDTRRRLRWRVPPPADNGAPTKPSGSSSASTPATEADRFRRQCAARTSENDESQRSAPCTEGEKNTREHDSRQGGERNRTLDGARYHH